MSVLADQPLRVRIAPDVQGERDFLPPPAQLKRRLLLADRGYEDVGYCDQVQRSGGDFVVRFRSDLNPRVIGGIVLVGRRPRRVQGVPKLAEVIERFWGKSLDLDVEWRRGSARVQVRVIAAWNSEKQEHMMLVTSLPREQFTAQHLLVLYRLRWQVELLFKEWKSYGNLHSFSTANSCIAEGLIWAALCAALLKRFLAHATQFVFSVAASTRCTAMALVHHLPKLLDALLRGRGVIHRLRELLRFLEINARRAHPKRDLDIGRLKAGLRHVAVASSPA